MAEINNKKPVNDGRMPELSFAAKEAYNLLRTNITFSFTDSDKGKVIGVSSPCPSEGKSFTAINLATALAEDDNLVLLVDCDLRRPTLEVKLDKPLSPGLTNLIVNNEKNVIHKGVGSENLSFVAAGDVPPNPSELIGSEKMQSVLDLFRQHFDYIILDLPPVLVVSDPLVASKYLDGMIMVVRHKTTKRREVMDAMRQLKMTGVRMLGFVYNGYRTGEGSGYKSYKNYKKYSSYYSSEKKTAKHE